VLGGKPSTTRRSTRPASASAFRRQRQRPRADRRQPVTVTPQGGATLTFGVTDIAAARAHLERHGVRFDGDTREIEGMVRLATFYDLDGNSFMLAQRLDRDEAGRGA
jgi:predicted enzyme related to lactoylglutathione lyase